MNIINIILGGRIRTQKMTGMIPLTRNGENKPTDSESGLVVAGAWQGGENGKQLLNGLGVFFRVIEMFPK